MVAVLVMLGFIHIVFLVHFNRVVRKYFVMLILNFHSAAEVMLTKDERNSTKSTRRNMFCVYDVVFVRFAFPSGRITGFGSVSKQTK